MGKIGKLRHGVGTVLLAAAFCMMTSYQVQASVIKTNGVNSRITAAWVDEHLGPGAAKWVDENGNVTAPPVAETEAEAEAEKGPGVGIPAEDGQDKAAGGEQSGASAEGESQVAGEQTTEALPEETQAAEEIQPEEQPAGRQIDPAKPMIALTFDDGPFAPVGNQIMDCLAQYGGKATFFVVGNRVPSYAAEMQRMAAEGHEIANHTYEHKYLTSLSAGQIQYQINKCNDVVQSVTGVRPTLVRLPGGLKNSTVLANVNAPIIMWNIDTKDWKTRNTQKNIDAVIGKVRDGDIVLMHELYSQTGAAAVQIIPKLVEQGYQLVTVSELASFRGGMQAGQVYNSFRP